MGKSKKKNENPINLTQTGVFSFLYLQIRKQTFEKMQNSKSNNINQTFRQSPLMFQSHSERLVGKATVRQRGTWDYQ